jgi:tripartite-type tricarboxylate transporter receptor subunit TctC
MHNPPVRRKKLMTRGGGETNKDLLSGEMKIMFSTIPPVLSFVKDGRLRGIATTGLKRDPALPELPTIAEAGVAAFDVPLWFGLAAPKGTPRPISRSWRRRSTRRLPCRTSRRR